MSWSGFLIQHVAQVSPVQSHLTGRPNAVAQGDTEHHLERQYFLSLGFQKCLDSEFSPNETTAGVCALKSRRQALVLPLAVVLRVHIYFVVPSLCSPISWLQIPQISNLEILEGLNKEPLKSGWRIKSQVLKLTGCYRAPDTHGSDCPCPRCSGGAGRKESG